MEAYEIIHSAMNIFYPCFVCIPQIYTALYFLFVTSITNQIGPQFNAIWLITVIAAESIILIANGIMKILKKKPIISHIFLLAFSIYDFEIRVHWKNYYSGFILFCSVFSISTLYNILIGQRFLYDALLHLFFFIYHIIRLFTCGILATPEAIGNV